MAPFGCPIIWVALFTHTQGWWFSVFDESQNHPG